MESTIFLPWPIPWVSWKKHFSNETPQNSQSLRFFYNNLMFQLSIQQKLMKKSARTLTARMKKCASAPCVSVVLFVVHSATAKWQQRTPIWRLLNCWGLGIETTCKFSSKSLHSFCKKNLIVGQQWIGMGSQPEMQILMEAKTKLKIVNRTNIVG